MTKNNPKPPDTTFEPASATKVGASEEAHAYRDDAQPKTGIGEAVRRRFAPFGGVELEPLPDEILRDPSAAPRRRKK